MSASDIVSRDSADAKESLAAWSASPDCVDWECRGLRLWRDKVKIETRNILVKGNSKAKRIDFKGWIKQNQPEKRQQTHNERSHNEPNNRINKTLTMLQLQAIHYKLLLSQCLTLIECCRKEIEMFSQMALHSWKSDFRNYLYWVRRSTPGPYSAINFKQVLMGWEECLMQI